jgi:hypothetical protein
MSLSYLKSKQISRRIGINYTLPCFYLHAAAAKKKISSKNWQIFRLSALLTQSKATLVLPHMYIRARHVPKNSRTMAASYYPCHGFEIHHKSSSKYCCYAIIMSCKDKTYFNKIVQTLYSTVLHKFVF